MASKIFPTNRIDPQVDPAAVNGLLTKESLPLFTPLIVDRVDKDQDHPHVKKCKKAKWLSGEALGIAFWLPRALSDLVARNWGPLGMGEGSPTPTRPRLRPARGDQVRRPDSAGTHPSV